MHRLPVPYRPPEPPLAFSTAAIVVAVASAVVGLTIGMCWPA